MATMILAATEVLTEFYFDVALINDQRGDRATYDTVWTLSVLRGFAMGIWPR